MGSKVQGPTTAGGCTPCGGSQRNRYYSGKRMRSADYELEQAYHIGRRRLVNRAMLGWGVIEGFEVRDRPRGVTVGAGLALDARGRELVAREATRLREAEDLVWLVPSGDACREFKAGDPPKPPVPAEDPTCDPRSGDAPKDGAEIQGKDVKKRCWLLSAHYAERSLDGVVIDDGCEPRCEPNSLCETVVYSLRPLECCEAGLPRCRCPRCAGEDTCACDDPPAGKFPPIGDRLAGVGLTSAEAEQPAQQWAPPDGSRAGEDDGRCFSFDRGNHRQLALWSLERREPAEPCGDARLSTHGCIAFDPCAGVPLACVTIAFHCGEPFIAEVVDAAHPRRLARRNEDLFDLVRGCDLTRIEDVGWSGWLAPANRRVAFTKFAEMFDTPVYPPEVRSNRRPLVPVSTRLTVTFTGPVRTDGLTTDVVVITLVSGEVAEALGNLVRVPVYDLTPDPPRPYDPAGTTRRFAVRVPSTYWEGELNLKAQSTFLRPTIVEIEIRTDFIDDCNRQQVAGGGRYPPSSGCVPGGRFLSSFVVVPDSWFDDDVPNAPGKGTGQEA